MALSPTKKKHFSKLLGPELMGQLETQTKELNERAEELGIAYKDFSDPDPDEDEDELEPQDDDDEEEEGDEDEDDGKSVDFQKSLAEFISEVVGDSATAVKAATDALTTVKAVQERQEEIMDILEDVLEQLEDRPRIASRAKQTAVLGAGAEDDDDEDEPPVRRKSLSERAAKVRQQAKHQNAGYDDFWNAEIEAQAEEF